MSKLVPELRFKDFKDCWESKKINELFSFSKGKGVSKDNLSDTGVHKVVLYGELNTHYGWKIDRVISRTNLEKEKFILSKKNQILLPSSGYVPTDMVCPVVILEDGVILSGDINILTPIKHNGGFLSLAFRANKEELSKVVQGTTVRHLYNNQIGVKTITITENLEEQDRIASFLSNIDKRIKVMEELRDLEKKHKKGLLQQLFVSNSVGGGALNSPSMRFEGFTEDWKSVKISDIFEITRGYVMSKNKVKTIKDAENKYPVYSSQTLNSGLMGYYKDFLFENCITWTTDGAKAGTVNLRSGKFYCTNVCGVLKSENYTNLCISEILNREAWKHVLHVGNPKLMNGVMGDIKIKIPQTVQEQEKISKLLTKLNNNDENNKIELEVFKDWKKGLLQRMFV